MDILKAKIVNKVKDLVKGIDWSSYGTPDEQLTSYLRENEVRDVGSQEIAIIIRTPAGPRWFIVKIKELM